MATTEEVNAIIKRFYESRTKSPMAKIDKSNLGIGLVLRYLAKMGQPVSAAQISRYMNVSTARVAVLLRTMQSKELIIKTEDASDARKVLISLSQQGKLHIEKAKAERLEMISNIINKIGVERMNLFLDISEEINEVMSAEMNSSISLEFDAKKE